MKAPDKIAIECTPGACLVHVIDEDGMVIFSEKFLMNEAGEIRPVREFTSPNARALPQLSAIRKKIAEAIPALLSLSKLLHKIEDQAYGGVIVEFS